MGSNNRENTTNLDGLKKQNLVLTLSEHHQGDNKRHDKILQRLQGNNKNNDSVVPVNTNKTIVLVLSNTPDKNKKPEMKERVLLPYDKHMYPGDKHKYMPKQPTFGSQKFNNKQLTFYKPKDGNGGAAAAA